MTDPIQVNDSVSRNYDTSPPSSKVAATAPQDTTGVSDAELLSQKVNKFNAIYAELQTDSDDNPDKVNVLNEVLYLLRQMIPVLQRIGMATANYLTLPTKMQAFYTNLISQYPYYVLTNPIDDLKAKYPSNQYKIDENNDRIIIYDKNNKNAVVLTVTKTKTDYGTKYTYSDGSKGPLYVQTDEQKCNNANSQMAIFMDNLKSIRDWWADQAKKTQTSLNTENEAVNAQIDILTSFFDQLKQTASKIFR